MNEAPLLDQIRVYSEALVENLPDTATMIVKAPAPLAPRPPQRSRGWAVAAAAATLTLIVLGSVAWLAPFGGGTSPVDEPTVTTILDEITVPETTVPTDAVVTPTTEPVTKVGTGWTRVPLDADVFGNVAVLDIAQGGDGLVAVGGPNPCEVTATTNTCEAVIWTSSDGLNWRRVDMERASGSVVHSVVAHGEGLVAIGSGVVHEYGVVPDDGDNLVWLSIDGLSWSSVEDPNLRGITGLGIGSDFLTITTGGPGLIAGAYEGARIGHPGVMWASADGRSWMRLTLDDKVFEGAQGFFVTSRGDELIAVAVLRAFASGFEVQTSIDGFGVWTSIDGGQRWDRTEVLWGDIPSHGIFDVVAGDRGILVGGTDIWYSPNGTEWTRADLRSLNQGTACQGRDLEVSNLLETEDGFFAVGHRCGTSDSRTSLGAVWASPDGSSWTLVSDDSETFGSMIRSVAQVGDTLIAFGNDHRSSPTSGVPGSAFLWTWTPSDS